MGTTDATDVTERPGLATRVVMVLVYTTLGALVMWRAWTYQRMMNDGYPAVPMLLCAALAAVLYVLSIVTLIGRSDVLAPVVVGGDLGDSTHRRVADRAPA